MCPGYEKIAATAIAMMLFLVGIIFALIGKYERKNLAIGVGYGLALVGLVILNVTLWPILYAR